MARPGQWTATDGTFSLTSTDPVSTVILPGGLPANTTVERVIGHADLFLFAADVTTANFGVLTAVHLLGSLADLGAGNVGSFTDAWLFWRRSGLFTLHFQAETTGYTDKQSIDFDVSGKRKLTASRPQVRFAAQARGVPVGGFIVVEFSMHTFFLHAP